MTVDWAKHKAVVVESDDWGGCAVYVARDYESYLRMTQTPPILEALMKQPSRFWAWLPGTLETPADMRKMFELLLRFRGADGRPAVFTPVYLVANPDFDAIRDNGCTEYVDIPICEGFPSRFDPVRWNHEEILAEAKRGMALGVWHPQTHGRVHHWSPRKWVRSLREAADEALTAFFELGMVGMPLDQDRLRELKGLEFDDLTDEELDEWFGKGLEYFRRAFGYETPVAPITNALWARAEQPDLERRCEQMLARHGVKFNSHSYKAREQGQGLYDPELDLTFMGWNSQLDPLGLPDCEAEKGFTTCYRRIEEAWAKGEPAIVGAHRANYVSLDPVAGSEGYGQLERLLSALTKEHPDLVFLTSWEVGQLYRKGWSCVRYGSDLICRNYSDTECEMTWPFEVTGSVSEAFSLPDGPTCAAGVEDGRVTLTAPEGDYLIRVEDSGHDD